jgi:GNAT superfamily N-acetyltransferase
MDVRRIDPNDDAAFGAWFAIWQRTDLERWPDIPGWSARVVKAMATQTDGSEERQCLSAVDGSGVTIGVALVELPRRDNRHRVSLDVRVPPEHRRRGIGTTLVQAVERLASEAGRSVLNGETDIPTPRAALDASVPFARALAFEARQTSHRRHLALPVEPSRLEHCRQLVAEAGPGYHCVAFLAPWPAEYLDDQCELGRRMSTDAPDGDPGHEEEVWDAARVQEGNDLLVAQGLTKLVAVAQHVESGRLVAFSEMVISPERPGEAWQWATLVRREHRGHRLGLAVKLANLDQLATVLPTATLVLTANAQENSPMIAVNALLGFEVASTLVFLQKDLEP